MVYREVTDVDAHGQVSVAKVGYHGAWKYNVAASFYDETGQAESIAVSANGSPLQTLNYYYDNFGNLETRSTTVGAGNTETFTFDNLQRLTSSYRSAGGSVSYSYDPSGSFLSKSDYASLYIYNPNRPHVLNQVNLVGGGSVSFTHDQNGNVTQGDGETITYNAFNKPLTITGGGNNSTFTYGANLMRYKQETPSGSTILYIDKLMEIETLGGSVDYKHYLGDVAILTKTGSLNDPSPSVNYLFRDRLGSVSMIGDAYAAVIEHRGYDAYGKPRNGNWTNKTPPIIGSSVTDRGFTDHEHLDDWQLIHMNGRGYDYNLGRFLSVDPFIQDPGNSQSINGYSYIGNNPLSGTDPTGYRSEQLDEPIRTGSRIPGGGGSISCAGCLTVASWFDGSGGHENGADNNAQSSTNRSSEKASVPDELNGIGGNRVGSDSEAATPLIPENIRRQIDELGDYHSDLGLFGSEEGRGSIDMAQQAEIRKSLRNSLTGNGLDEFDDPVETISNTTAIVTLVLAGGALAGEFGVIEAASHRMSVAREAFRKARMEEAAGALFDGVEGAAALAEGNAARWAALEAQAGASLIQYQEASAVVRAARTAIVGTTIIKTGSE